MKNQYQELLSDLRDSRGMGDTRVADSREPGGNLAENRQ